MPKLIYIADDEENIRLLIKAFLENEGYEVRAFSNGKDILRAFEEQRPDLMILDIMMPGVDGLSICSEIRNRSSVPIIIVSAKDTPLDRVTGLTLGSDDYISKPFLPLELIARVKAIFRRTEMTEESEEEQIYECGNMRIEQGPRKVFIDNNSFSVTPTEYEFLLYLIKRKDTAVSKKDILRAVWDYRDPSDNRVIDDLVKRLRKKLREASCTALVETVWGFGFRLSSEFSQG